MHPETNARVLRWSRGACVCDRASWILSIGLSIKSSPPGTAGASAAQPGQTKCQVVLLLSGGLRTTEHARPQHLARWHTDDNTALYIPGLWLGMSYSDRAVVLGRWLRNKSCCAAMKWGQSSWERAICVRL